MNVMKLIGSMLVASVLASSCSSSTTNPAVNSLNTLSGSARCNALAGLNSKRFDLEISESIYVASS